MATQYIEGLSSNDFIQQRILPLAQQQGLTEAQVLKQYADASGYSDIPTKEGSQIANIWGRGFLTSKSLADIQRMLGGGQVTPSDLTLDELATTEKELGITSEPREGPLQTKTLADGTRVIIGSASDPDSPNYRTSQDFNQAVGSTAQTTPASLGGQTQSPIGNQLGALQNNNTSSNVGNSNNLASQYQALLGLSPEEQAAQKAIQDQQNAFRTGTQNIGEQPIGMQFISGQQADLEKRNVNLQIPLQQQLANAQQKRQASLDAVRFQLDRSDKETARQDSLKAQQLDENYRRDVLKADTSTPASTTTTPKILGNSTTGYYTYNQETGETTSINQPGGTSSPTSTTSIQTDTPSTSTMSKDQIKALQTQLNAQGANLKVDGIMGPLTKAAMEKYGSVGGSYEGSPGASYEQWYPQYLKTSEGQALAKKFGGDNIGLAKELRSIYEDQNKGALQTKNFTTSTGQQINVASTSGIKQLAEMGYSAGEIKAFLTSKEGGGMTVTTADQLLKDAGLLSSSTSSRTY